MKSEKDGFVWGVATSAYQIEGAANEDGRGLSIWDVFSATPGNTIDGETGEMACDHYHRYREDVSMIRSLGVDAYRFSCAWPRVQPEGRGAWNERGWDFYARLLDALEESGIAAHATLYHWDLPHALELDGGWRNRDTTARFSDYAAEFARRFGQRVATISTHNEPWCTAILGHERGMFAPGLCDRAAAYQVAHHLLLSHGLAVRAMRCEGSGAELGIVLNQWPVYPARADNAAELRACRLADALCTRWYMDPLFLGAYPSDGLAFLGHDAPKVQAGDFDVISEPIDFLGLNYYMRQCGAGTDLPPPALLGVTDMGWEIYPDGLTEHLVRLARSYNPPPIYIMENGAAFPDQLSGDVVHDPRRIDYLKRHIEAVWRAKRSGVELRGYFAWSLMDNYEWNSGYSKRFGLVYVDYENQRRILKDSARWYRDFIASQRSASAES